MFAMAIMDPGAGKYLLVRDRYGKKPMFYTSVRRRHLLRLGAEGAQAARYAASGQDQSRAEYGLLAPRAALDAL